MTLAVNHQKYRIVGINEIKWYLISSLCKLSEMAAISRSTFIEEPVLASSGLSPLMNEQYQHALNEHKKFLKNLEEVKKTFQPVRVFQPFCSCGFSIGSCQWEYEARVDAKVQELKNINARLCSELLEARSQAGIPAFNQCCWDHMTSINIFADEYCRFCMTNTTALSTEYATAAKEVLGTIYWKSAQARVLDDMDIWVMCCRNNILTAPVKAIKSLNLGRYLQIDFGSVRKDLNQDTPLIKPSRDLPMIKA
jgi:DNA-directed RNA polymerase subunit N (RpoN/RPB10)